MGIDEVDIGPVGVGCGTIWVVIDEVNWQRATFDLSGFAEEAALAGRLADVRDQLIAWRDGDALAGGVAADALDQLDGVLADLALDLPRAREAVAYLLGSLPRTAD